jgi:hypothetical protein
MASFNQSQNNDQENVYFFVQIRMVSIGVPINLNLLTVIIDNVQLQRRYKLLDNKLKFFALTTVIVCSLLIPLTIPHILHQSMIYHIILHIVSLNISVFLGLVSIFAYLKNNKIRMLFMALGFVTLAIVEAIMLLTSTGNLSNIILPSVNIELPHIVLLIMLTLFGLGLLKAN